MPHLRRLLIAQLAWFVLLHPEHATASAERARPVFTEDRKFIVNEREAATEIDVGIDGIKVSVFDRAVTERKLDLRAIQQELREALQPRSPLWKVLNLLFPSDSRERFRKTGIPILIDDFSQFSSRRPIFASYFLREPIRVIGLDSSELARAYWLPSLAHEITHALLVEMNLESWWEEALAQLIERQVGGMQPELTLKTLGEDGPLPFLLDAARPLALRKNYALSFLFAKYLSAVGGGWQGLRIASRLDGADLASPRGRMDASSDTLTELSRRLRHSQEQELRRSGPDSAEPHELPGTAGSLNSPLLSSDKLTREGLLRFFIMALVINHPRYARYRIPDWNGVLNSERNLEGLSLEPGQFVLSKLNALPTNLSDEVEVYRLLQGPDGEVVIRPRHQFTQNQVPFRIVSDRTVVMNLTKGPLPVLLQPR
jgi:hypothetical protein